MGKSGALDCRYVHERVLRAVFRLNEAKAFLGIEPLDRSDRHVSRSSMKMMQKTPLADPIGVR
jgi:hypothetical protein